jgi:hypothetical protein
MPTQPLRLFHFKSAELASLTNTINVLENGEWCCVDCISEAH